MEEEREEAAFKLDTPLASRTKRWCGGAVVSPLWLDLCHCQARPLVNGQNAPAFAFGFLTPVSLTAAESDPLRPPAKSLLNSSLVATAM